MFVRELTADVDYFLAKDEFASLKYDGESVTYSFELYGRLIQALIDGHDNIKIQLIQRFNPKFKYFVGSSKEDVEISNLGFVQNTKESLQKAIKSATVSEIELELVNLLSDDIVSDVGSGIVNETNYTDFLPVIEQIRILNRTSRRKFRNTFNTQNFQKSTLELFRKSGVYPGKVIDISFPAQKLGEDTEGLSFAVKTPAQRALLSNTEFSDYYNTFYVKDTNTKIRQRFQKAKAEYQRFKVDMRLDLAEYNLSRLVNYENLGLRISLVDDDIEVASDVFRFQNALLFEEATAGARKIETSIVIHDPIAVLPDTVSVTNREIYPVEVTVNEFYLDNNIIERNQLGIETLNPNESIEFEGARIYFDQSESRSYAVTANKYIPGVAGVSNVLSMLSPPTSNVPPKLNPNFDIQVKPGEAPNTAELMVSGLASSAETALIYKKRIGGGERELIGRAIEGRIAIVDKEIHEGDVYVYTAELQLNSASRYGSATTGYVAFLGGNVNRINFSLTDQQTRGTSSSPKHSFKILESITSTAAADLLNAANKSGQAGIFSSEIEASKQDTTIISSYMIYRIQKSNNRVQNLGVHSANKKLTFGFNRAGVNRYKSAEVYEYIVIPRSVGLASLSYTTVVEGTDTKTGNAYKYSYKKFRDPNFQRSVVLPSYGQVIRNNIQAAFNELPPGGSTTLEFSSALKPGSIRSLNAVSKDNLDCAFISWKYSGDISGVLHFVVFANYNGFKAPIGLAIPDQVKGSNITISYCDEKLGDVAGEVLYSIMPVLRTGAAGKESNGVSVSSNKNYPSKALKR